MFDKIKNKINDMKIEAQKRREEEERIEREKLEQEKQRLLAMSEKELLVEIIFEMRDIAKGNKSLIERIESLESAVSTTNFELDNLKSEKESF